MSQEQEQEQVIEPTEQTTQTGTIEEPPKENKPRGRPRKEKPPKPPRVNKTADIHEYMRQYYIEKIQKERTNCICKICNKDFNTAYALNRHHQSNKSCMLIKLQQRLDTMMTEA